MYTRTAARILVGMLGVASVAAAQAPPPSPVPPVSLVGRPVIQFDASRRDGTGALRVISPTDRNVVLDAGPLIDPQTKDTIAAAINLEPAELSLVANVPQTVTATVSGVLVDGSAEFEILAGTMRVGTVTVTRGPFAVSVAGDPVTFETGKTTVLTLRNDSRHQYTVKWMINLGPHRYCGGPVQHGEAPRACDETATTWSEVKIPPKDSNQIHIVPPDDWFDTSVTSKPENVTLSLAPGPDLPKRVQQLAVTLVGPRVAWQPYFILSWLLLGAVMSLLVRHWVPNTQRKRDLKEHTGRVRAKIDAFSDDIDYELRAQTRVQGHLLESLRRSAYTAFPHYESVATQCAAGLSMLEKRVDLIEEIDSVFAIERVKWQSCPPPSQIDRVEMMLRGALEALKKAHLSEPEFLTVKGEVERARTITNQMGSEGAEFGQELATRLKAIGDELETYGATEAYKELQALLPGLLGSLTPPAGGAAPGEISPLRYSLIDYNLSALQICRDYIWLASGAAGTNKPSIGIRDALVQHLARQSWGELRLARLLLKQFREDASEEQIWKEIEAGDAGIYVVHEPIELRPLQLVQFRIYFRRSELNWAGAKALVSPEWQFSDGSRPRGWAISQFFTANSLPTWSTRAKWWWKGKKEENGPSTEEVLVHFEGRPDASGNVRRKTDALTLKLQIQPSRAEGRRARTVTEVLGLAVSIAIPFITLAATASAQLTQNPTGGGLMIFLLGFSSDALIAVFKQRATGTP